LNPRDAEERRQILTNLGTESIWTSDIVWQLHTWTTAAATTTTKNERNNNNNNKDITSKISFKYVLLSRNITCADATYEEYSYYQHNYEHDQIRVRNTFQKLKSQHAVPMKEITNKSIQLQLSTVIELISMNDIVAIVLLDNNVLWKKRDY
jgi:hypothetical protein